MLGFLVIGLLAGATALVGATHGGFATPHAAHQVAPVDNPANPNGFGSGTNFRLYPGDDENVAIENNRAAPETPAAIPEDAPAE